MSSYINTNMVSLNTQNNLTKSQGALATSIQRLSSGLRVNGAKDDAAGFAIASRMDSNIKGQTVAVRNANDAISYSQTAEGALTTVTNNLQRMRELAVQASNGTNGSSDNASLNTEFTQLQSEINRVTGNTQFNGKNVLSGGTVTFQIGSGTTSNDSISITGLDLTAATNKSATAYAASAGNDSQLLQASQALTAAGVDTTATTGNAAFDTTTGQIKANTGATLNSNQTAAINAYNSAFAQTDLGKGISAKTVTATSGAFDASTGAIATSANITDSSTGTTGAAAKDVTSFTNSLKTGTKGIDLNTADQAKAAIDAIDNALTEVNTESIKQGANQNRFAAVITTLQTSTENQTAAKSRIMDTDYAAETATLARGQILQQAGMAMLAQANQLPNGVMALMR